MRIFLAGASGVLGVRLVPLLVAKGHAVAGMTRSPAKVERLRALGAEPVVCDVYDAAALREAVTAFRPALVMHQLTDLPDDEASLANAGEANARMRREGTGNLMAAAEGAGAERFLAQSVAWELTGAGGAAKEELERAVLGFGGVILRYGRFYGSGTYHAEPPDPPRIQIDQAARRTAGLLDAPSGIVEVVQVDVQAGLKPWRSGSARCSPADSRRPRSGTARLRLPRSGGVAAPPAESRLRVSASSSA